MRVQLGDSVEYFERDLVAEHAEIMASATVGVCLSKAWTRLNKATCSR